MKYNSMSKNIKFVMGILAIAIMIIAISIAAISISNRPDTKKIGEMQSENQEAIENNNGVPEVKINEKVILKEYIDMAFETQREVLSVNSPNTRSFDEISRDEVRDGLIEREILLLEAEKRGIAVSSAEVEEYIEDIRAGFPGGERYNGLSDEEKASSDYVFIAISDYAEGRGISMDDYWLEAKEAHERSRLITLVEREILEAEGVPSASDSNVSAFSAGDAKSDTESKETIISEYVDELVDSGKYKVEIIN